MQKFGAAKRGVVWRCHQLKIFSQAWKEPRGYIVIIDATGSWVYRLTPSEDGSTLWPGINRHNADRTVQATLCSCIEGPEGLKTNVDESVPNSVQLSPVLPAEAACARANIEGTNWDFTSNAWGSMMWELYGKDRKSEDGPFNFWNYFEDTGQMCDNYSPNIMGDISVDATGKCRGIPTPGCPCSDESTTT